MTDLIQLLKAELQNPLPGEVAHYEVIPVNRPISSEALKDAEYYRESGVALILTVVEESIHCVLMKRSVHPGNPHSGQISFPGGKKEDYDSDLESTARRETREEIGVDLSPKELIGELTPIYIPVSKFRVQPFVYFRSGPMTFIPDPLEVDQVFTFEVNDLLRTDIIKRKEIRLSQGYTQKNAPYFDINGETVWGATAMMLSEFRQIILRI